MDSPNAILPALLTSLPPYDAVRDKSSYGIVGKRANSNGALQQIPGTLSEVTPSFMDHALRCGNMLPANIVVESISMDYTATAGLLSTTGRAQVKYATLDADGDEQSLPHTFIVKLQSENEESRAVAVGANNYAMEALAYTNFADEMVVGTSTCFYIAHDSKSGNYVFVMEDLSLRVGVYAVSQFDGCACNKQESLGVAHALGQLHAQYWQWEGSLSASLSRTCDIEARNVAALVCECGADFKASAYYTSLSAAVRSLVDEVMLQAEVSMSVLQMGPADFVTS
jgi:hypothetical protein